MSVATELLSPTHVRDVIKGNVTLTVDVLLTNPLLPSSPSFIKAVVIFPVASTGVFFSRVGMRDAEKERERESKVYEAETEMLKGVQEEPLGRKFHADNTLFTLRSHHFTSVSRVI